MTIPRAKPWILTIVASFAISLGAPFGPFLAKPVHAQSARDAPVAREVPTAAPTSRMENWLIYYNYIDGSEQAQYWPRFYIPFNLPRGWTFTQRIDLPVAYTNSVGPENPTGEWKSGINDWFVEEIFTTPEVAKNTTLAASVRFVFPTGGLGPFGNGQYEWAPGIGLSYSDPERVVTISPFVRYFMSYYSNDESAGKVRTLDLFPTITLGLKDGWSVSFYSENPIAYNDVTNKWFVPIDVLLLKRVSKNIDFTIGGAYGLIKDAPNYQYIINASLAVYF
jgi:hypothetical protein